MKKLLLRIFTWIFWKNFHIGLKSVLGHKTLAESLKEMQIVERVIRSLIGKYEEPITWENTKHLPMLQELCAKYLTLKYFNEVGQLLALFMAVDKKRILGGR